MDDGRYNFQLSSAFAPLCLTTDDTKSIHVLARQPIDMSRPHPFIEAGNREFNMFLWMPPNGDRAGDILFADMTIFSTLFGGMKSLENFWRNLAKTPLEAKGLGVSGRSGVRAA